MYIPAHSRRRRDKEIMSTKQIKKKKKIRNEVNNKDFKRD